MWDVESGNLETQLQTADSAVAALFSPDSRYLVTGNAEIYHLYRVADWELIWSVERFGDETELPGSIAFSADGKLLAIRLDRVRVQLLDAATGIALATLESPDQDPLTALSFTPDGNMLVAGSTANRVQVWYLERMLNDLAELRLDVPDVEADR